MSEAGNLAWLMMASAMVLLMTPGLAFFYAGLGRTEKLINTLMLNFITIGVVSIIWLLWGYSLAFSGGNWFIGDFNNAFLGNIDWSDGNTVAFITFQGMFAIITPALITGAIIERFKFTTYLIFLVLWVSLVYVPICHWVWAESGWLFQRGALDFAGGTVVHINAGIASVVAAYLVGPRKFPNFRLNIPFVLLGTALLWFGWFGFNAGSQLAADSRAVNAFLVTNIAAGSAMTTWFLLEYIKTRNFSPVALASGAVAGLVAITPASGFVTPLSALIIGFLAGSMCYGVILLKERYKGHLKAIDDALDVFPIHGIAGIIGAIATGVFAVEIIGGTKGLVEGNTTIMLEQVIAVLATIGYSAVASFVILFLLKKTIGLRDID